MRLSLLQKFDPKKLMWHEIVDTLYPTYQPRYSSKEGFGSAVSIKLNLLEAAGITKHEGVFYEIRKLPESQEIIVGIDKPDAHLLAVASGLMSLCDVTKYRVEGQLYPNPEFRELALQHARTGYPNIFQAVVEMARWRPACLEYAHSLEEQPKRKGKVKKTAECMTEYNKSRQTFNRESNLLASRIENGVDKLQTSYCKICEVMHSRTVSGEDERQTRELLRIVWDVTE